MMFGDNIASELHDFLRSGYYESPLRYNNEDWFVEHNIRLERKLAFYLQNTSKDFIMTQEEEEEYRNNNICRFCLKNIISDKVGDPCDLTGKNIRPAHNKCNINVTQKQSNFIPFIFHILGDYDCHLLFKQLVHKKKIKKI